MITVTTPNAAKISFSGTTTEMPSFFGWVSFEPIFGGKRMRVTVYSYQEESDYLSNKNPAEITGVEGFNTRCNEFDLAKGTTPESWDLQTIGIAHDKIKELWESLGYVVVISGI